MIETPPGAPHRSPDGQWEWNGTQWIPAQPAPGSQQIAESGPTVHAAPPGSTVPPTQTNPVSPDGKHQWNGTGDLPPTPPGSGRASRRASAKRGLFDEIAHDGRRRSAGAGGLRR